LLNGLRRGAIKEGILLIAVLLGALLVTLWGERGGVAIARRMSWQPGTGQWLAAMGLLWGAVLGTGYAPGALLRARQGKMPLPMRVIGAVLGLLTAGLLLALSLRYTQVLLYGDAAGRKATWIRSAVATRFLLERFDVMLLGLVWGIAMVSLVVIVGQLIMRLISPNRDVAPARQRTAPMKPVVEPQPSILDSIPSSPGSSAPVPPGMERSFIDRSRSTSGSDRIGPS
jgi:hypothetical protein